MAFEAVEKLYEKDYNVRISGKYPGSQPRDQWLSIQSVQGIAELRINPENRV